MQYAPGVSGLHERRIIMSNPILKRTNDVSDVRTYIKQCIDLKFGTMTAYATKEGVSLQYISNVMSGNKPIPDWMLKRFKVKHVVVETWERAAA